MNEWMLIYDGFDPDQEGLREALCTVGNGYFATRGAAPESSADGVHYPGTYVAGVYNRLSSEVSGRTVENESLVNVPNWLPLDIRIDDGEWIDEHTAQLLDHRQELDLHRGVLARHTRFVDPAGRILRLTQRRIVSMAEPHLAALETTLVPENFSATLTVRSALDGTVANTGVARYNSLPTDHLRADQVRTISDESVCLVVETNQSRIRVAEAARTRIVRNGERVAPRPDREERPGYVALTFSFPVQQGDEVIVEKVVALYTSRDAAISEPGLDACDQVNNVAPGFDELLSHHVVAWRHLWQRTEVELGSNSDTQLLLHLHMFHVMATVSPHTSLLDVGVPARGLHGEAYRGHIFWDELFIFPFFSFRLPELTRSLLLYRYRRLDHARRAARDAGYEGAMFPWQSASNGREETQTMHLNPDSGHWLPDASHLQRHVNGAIVYNIWHYYQATGDDQFLRSFGAEMVVEIARFWASIATYDHAEDRFEIKGVMGPDEYHEGYPDRDEPGLDNNAYTNLMAVWCLCRALEVFEALPPGVAAELRERLVITPRELDRWDEISRKMKVCFHDGVISQFEGYEQLEELDWEDYQARYPNISRLDRILEAEGDTPNRYKLAKQADVLMLFYLFTAEELAELLERLAYEYDKDLIPRNIAYYEPRTSHGSTLSKVVHSWIFARSHRDRSWDWFLYALHSDINDLQGGTTPEGIHLGAMAGTIDLIQRCYTGIELRAHALRLNPAIPDELGSLSLGLRYRGQLLHLDFTAEVVRVRASRAQIAPVTLECWGQSRDLHPGETAEFKQPEIY